MTAKPFTASGNQDIFRCFPLPFTFTEDVWLTAVQVVPNIQPRLAKLHLFQRTPPYKPGINLG
jgi:hypothetical protein